MYTNRADSFSRARARSGRVGGFGLFGFIDPVLVAEFESVKALLLGRGEPDPIAEREAAEEADGTLVLEAHLSSDGPNAHFPIQPGLRRACRANKSFEQLLSEAVWRVEGCEYEFQ